jgi:hypothetical protein
MIPFKCYLQTFPFNQKKIAIKSIDETNNYSGSNTPSYYLRIQQNISNPTNRLFLQLVAQELLTLQEHLSSPHPSVFSGVRVTRSLVFCVCFVDSYLSFCTLSFGHCVVCSSSIYGFF